MLYICPEQLRGCITQGSQKADVYAFAIILEEILARKGPFSQAAETMDILGGYDCYFMF